MKDRTIHITREFDTPHELVFDAFTAPEKISQWWGPNGFTTTTKSMEFNVGGEWIFTMHGPDGTYYPNRVVYTEIKHPELLKYDHFAGYKKDGKPPHFKQTITFEEVNGKTKVEMNLLFPTPKKRHEAAEFGAIEGGHQTLSRLAEFLEKNNSTDNH
ncbi:ATPase [Rhodohalobacter sp. SW132]|uniref:SRPBCC family protein n=1 Tax=Rhodohalobacter sp. SW132 TaxID=2293433 RepID=UPI000E2784CD|nr:SRPBCC family protein [Rhodohalobacter sp. SW132]REL24034.1 ATPase [Rhodohalobacter sp. SW132]